MPVPPAPWISPLGDASCKAGTAPRAVRVAGPAGIVITGTSSCIRGTLVVRVTGGSGIVGGMALRAADFSGTLTSGSRGLAGRVVVALPRHPDVIPAWSTTARLTLVRAAGAWTSTVTVVEAHGADGSLRMAGPLAANGSYRLTARGGVSFARTTVPLAGWYTSGTTPVISSASGPRWSITGSGADGSVTGAVLQKPRVAMTQTRPGITGTTTLVLASPLGFAVPARLDIVGTARWTARANGSGAGVWSPPGMPFATVAMSRISGTLGVVRSRTVWNLVAPLTVVDDALTVTGTMTIRGVTLWRLQATGGSGRILGSSIPLTVTGGAGSVLVNGSTVTGSLGVVASDELLFDVPDSWTTTTDYRLTPRLAGQAYTLDRSVAYRMAVSGRSVVLTGSIPRSGGFRLDGGGALDISGAPVPVAGYYASAGYVVDGVPLTRPDWNLRGTIPGRVGIQGGAGLRGGYLQFLEAVQPAPIVRRWGAYEVGRAPAAASDTTAVVTVTVTGATSLQLTVDDAFTINCNYQYTDSENWTLTAAGNYTDTWTPFQGFSIPDVGFTGTVVSTDGVETWNVTTSQVVWTGMVTGATMTTSFSLGNSCPLVSHCPDDDTDAIYVGSNTAAVDFDTIPDVTAAGAFTTDLEWMRWDATSAPVTFDGITVDDVDLTAFIGERDDANPDLDMPDLSATGGDNGVQVQLCGDFTVPVPDITTLNTGGCISWTEAGVVMGQINTGGSVAGTSIAPSNGVSVNGASLSGFAWTDLASVPSIGLNGITLPLSTGKNYVTGTVGIPGTVMHDFGTGISVDTAIPASGWFTVEGDFELDATIPIGLTTSTVSLDSITAHIERDGEDYSLGFEADGTINTDGHHYPAEAYIGYEKAEDTSITVSLSVQGTYTTMSQGSFDVSSLLTEGDFEPPNDTLIDGSFDSGQQSSVITDGGLENATVPTNLVSNPGFESGMNANLVPAGADTFDGSTGNQLPNNDFETFDTLLNGDYEGSYGSLGYGGVLGWTMTSTSFVASSVSGSAPTGDSNPESGQYVMQLTNNGSTLTPGSSTAANGAMQYVPQAMTNGTTYTLSTQVASTTSTAVSFQMALVPQGCASTVATVVSPVFSAPSTWGAPSSISITGTSAGCSGFNVYLTPLTSKGSVYLDQTSLQITASTSVVSQVVNVKQPDFLSRFDSTSQMANITKTANVYTTSDGNGGSYLRSDGCNGWNFASSTFGGAINGDFDMRVRIMFAGSSGRDIADVGFWLNQVNGGPQGYYFRIQTANGDGGFATVNGSTKAGMSGNVNVPNVGFNTWYDVHLTAVGTRVTAVVTNLSTNSVVYNNGISIPTTGYPRSGAFGQVYDGACTSSGQRWDDMQVYSPQGQVQVRWDPANAHSGNGYGSITSSSTWSAQYSTGAAPAQGSTYSYSTWVRASSGSISGSAIIETESASSGTSSGSATHESVTVPFTATSSGWTQVVVNMTVQNANHTDLIVGLLDVTTANGAALYLDDQQFQLLPWESGLNSPLTNVWTSTDSTGNSVLNYQDTTAYPSEMSVTLPAAPAGGAVYTVTADVRLSAGTTNGATLKWLEQTQSPSIDFMPTSSWQTISLTVTSQGGSQDPTVAIYLSKGTMQVDNVSVTASAISSSSSGLLGAPAMAPGWSYYGVNGAHSNDNASTAHSGYGSLNVGSETSVFLTIPVSPAPTVGRTYTASLYLRDTGSTSHATVSLTATTSSGSITSASTSVTAGSDYQLVTVNLQITNASTTGFTLEVNNTGLANIRFDDVTVTQQGLGFNDAWVPYVASGAAEVSSILDDPTQAHSGSNYLQITGQKGDAGLSLTVPYTPLAGSQHSFGAWVRSQSGATLSGYIELAITGPSTSTLSRVQGFTLSDAAWHFVYVTVPLTSTSGTAVEMMVVSQTPGLVLQVDDMDSRAEVPFVPYQSGNTNLTVISNPARAANGPNYATMTNLTSGTSGMSASVSTDPSGVAIDVTAGSIYTMSTYVRSTTGAPVNGSLQLNFGTKAGTPNSSATFAANGSWQLITVDITAPVSASSIVPMVLIPAGTQLDVDTLTVVPKEIDQDQPWAPIGTTSSTTIAWGVYDDASRAYDGSNGLLEISKSGSGVAGLTKGVSAAPTVGQVYTASAWVRSSTGTAIAGYLSLGTVGGTYESAQSTFTASSTWQLVTIRFPITQSGHTSMNAALYITDSSGATLDVDNVFVQLNDWQVSTTGGSTAVQTIINNGGTAQQGTGYLQLTNAGSGSAAAYLDDSQSFASGTEQVVSAYVRSTNGTPVTGTLEVGPPGGSAQTSAFTAGAGWTKVTVSYTPGSALSALRLLVRNSTPNTSLDIDTVNLTDETGSIDGITTPLPHPESGYAYLWDDAFGIKGAHLWAITGQVQFVNGTPALGIGATAYFDPSQSPIMTGTAWLKGDMALDVSYPPENSCFSFDFDSTGTGSGVSVGKGVFTATEFSINAAPTGCTVGPYVVPRGASLTFEAQLGDGTVSMDLAIGTNDDGPYASGDFAVNNIVIGGTTFKTMQLSVYESAVETDVSFVGDFILPVGTFNGDFTLTADTSQLYMSGDVELTDWQLAGNSFDVQEMSFSTTISVPFGDGTCSSWSDTTTSGLMSMGQKTKLSFDGQLAMGDCELQILMFEYEYQHGGVTQEFRIDYDAATYLLAGGAYFKFQRDTSWKFLSHRYRRHPNFAIGLSFSMDVRYPSSATMTLGGTVSVANGSGTIVCTFSGGTGDPWADDECTLDVYINILGNHHYHATW